jgi:gamma-glutamylcyclotransferase (GGCT)/AIG2-like uncharacterized protein YtfP
MLPYFAYGANMDERHMHGRVPNARALGPARLGGFRLAFDVYSTEWQGGAADVAPDADGHVWGVLWDVPDEELKGLDAFQGHPTFFRREEMVVELGGEMVSAWTYRVAHQEGYVRPTDAYLAHLYSAIRVQGLPPEAFDLVERAARPPKPTIST